MDLRIKETLRKIKEAYLHEKRTKTISEIRVIDICKIAKINKTTFYRHYCDIYDLSDTIENELIESLVEQMKYVPDLLIDPEKFVKKSLSVFEKENELIHLIFDERSSVLISKVENTLINKYIIGHYSNKEILLIKFCMGGASRIITDSLSKEERKEVEEFLIEMMNKMIR